MSKKKRKAKIGINNTEDNFVTQIGIVNESSSADSGNRGNNKPSDNSIGILNEDGAVNHGIKIVIQDL